MRSFSISVLLITVLVTILLLKKDNLIEARGGKGGGSRGGGSRGGGSRSSRSSYT